MAEIEERSFVAKGAPLDDGQVRVGGTASGLWRRCALIVWEVKRRLGKAAASRRTPKVLGAVVEEALDWWRG